jgi:hypothetical protein
VGVTTQCDLLTASLDDSAGRGAEQEKALLEKLVPLAPPGLRFLRAEPLKGKAAAQPLRIDYERPVTPELAGIIRRRLRELTTMAHWPMERQTPAKARARRKAAVRRKFDIRPFLENIHLAGNMLRWSHVSRRGKWARPAELLRLLGMDEPEDLASVTRTNVEYAF